MEIISVQFFVFVLVTLAVYYLLSQRAQNIWLLLSSYVFYAFWNISFVVVLAITTAMNFFVANKIWQNGKNKKGWLFFGIIIDVIAFAALKLFVSDIFIKPIEINLSILIPLGFSFYILQAISYLLDVQNQRLSASTNLIDFAVYMAYFPKMVSGPIERARTFLPILAAPRVVDQKKLADGFTLMAIGLIRKIIFAQFLSSSLPKDIFQIFGQNSGLNIIYALILFAFWLYNDFAGYTSLVRGISLLFGIELSPNFQQPYFSRNFTEFWNRWHISLSHWLRDYLYYPFNFWLAKRNRTGSKLVNLAIPPLVTMLVSGLWHNFSFSMLIWGGLHAVYQIIERFNSLWHPHPPIGKQPIWKQILSGLAVYGLTIIAWVPFATGSVANIFNLFGILIGRSFFDFPGSIKLQFNQMILPIVLILLTLLMDWCQYHWKDETIFNKIPPVAKGALLAVTLLSLLTVFILQSQPVATFIYQGF